MLENEQKVLDALCERFKTCDKENAVLRQRRVFLTVDAAEFMQALSFAKDELGFDHLCTITGVDNTDSYEFAYHVSSDEGILLTLKYKTPGGDGVEIPSVLPIHNGATFYELELEGLFGVKVKDLPETRQYPLPDNWPKGQYPGRKAWTPNANKE